jgi:hypothetical protein
MTDWKELRQAVASLGRPDLPADLAQRCLQGLDVLESLGRDLAGWRELCAARPAAASPAAAAGWLERLDRAVADTIAPRRVLVIKTMHRPHGLREVLPFDDNTTLRDVERQLIKRYQASIHE